MCNSAPAKALNLDAKQQQDFVKYYRSLPQKPAGTIRFFNRTDFYTVHDDDATFSSQEMFSNHPIKYMGEAKLSYLVINRNNFDKFVKHLLLIKKYRVEVYVNKSGKNNDWKIEYKGSPGNISQFEDLFADNSCDMVNAGVMAINLCKNMMMAACYINIPEAQMLVAELTDNEFFTELEGLVAMVTPKECVIPNGSSPELNTLTKMLERNGVLVATAKSTQFKGSDVHQDLNRLLYFLETLPRNSLALPEINLTDAMSCLQVAIKHLNLIEDEQYHNHFKLSYFDVRNFMRVDNAAMEALYVFPKSKERFTKNNSLYGILDKCATLQGKRLLSQWLRQPLRDINLITERLEVVEAFVKDSEARHELSENLLTRVPDLLLLTRKLSGKRATLKDCYRIYQTVVNVPGINRLLKRLDNTYVTSTLVEPLQDLLIDCDKYREMIEKTLDFSLVDNGEFLIRPDYNEDLLGLAKDKAAVQQKIENCLKTAAASLGLQSGKSMRLEFTEQNGYCFRVTPKEEPILRKKKTFTMITSLKSCVRFTNTELTGLNENYLEIRDDYVKQQKGVVQEIVDVAVGYVPTLRNLNLCIAKLDVLVSFANVATNAPLPFVKPKLLQEGSGKLKLKKIRHPCLELLHGVTYIPNDVSFASDVVNLYIVTGPNMGGKSTYIRSIGVCVLLAQIGSYVPCAEAEISIVDSILARLGAKDCEVKGLSTFMVEMIETSCIIKTATSNSLIIIDELGRGTSTYDGCGLAWAIVEHLATQIKCFSLFATHFHDVTELAEKHSVIHNAHVTAVTTEDTITPLYQVREGPCDKSYGIHCARLAKLPEELITLATENLQKLEDAEGLSRLKDYEVALRRKTIQEGDLIIRDFLQKCKEIDLNSLSKEEVMEHVRNLLNESKKGNNEFVNGLMEKL